MLVSYTVSTLGMEDLRRLKVGHGRNCMLDRPSIAVKKSAVKKSVVMRVGALLAMMAILVLSNPAPNGVFAHDGVMDPDHINHIHYAENRTDAVRDFDSTDPEGSGIEWNVRGVDAADFAISSAGVLTFMASPDFEDPTDRARDADDLNDDGNVDPGEEAFAAGKNDYQITVSATEMRAGANAPLPAKRTDIALTVIVGNEDDDGDLTLQWLQPEVTVAIGTTLTDPDGDTTGEMWTWYISKATSPVIDEDSHWNKVANQDTPSYSPVAANEGRYLWVRVEYTDPEGVAKTADAKSENPVRAAVSSGANASPDFEDAEDDRTVPESTAVGDHVGAPVTATDTDNDTLTYELIAVASPNDDDDDFFDIDMATGQITVAQELDYDAAEGRTEGATAGEYKVVVRATDPSGLADNITVTITAVNVNEDPVVTGRAELRVAEEADDGYTTLQDAPGIGEPPNPTNQQNEYVYEDPDHLDSIARWTLEGDDAGAFDQSGRFEPRYIQFKVAPDYENPTDMNRDNVYEVTLVATDTDPLGTGAGIGKVNVWLTVINVEEAGKVVFTEGETAYLNEMLVAEVQDPDDKGGDLGEPYQGVHIVSWQWSKSTHEVDPGDKPFVDIPGATTNRYTAKNLDRGYYLRATATYTDPHSDEDDSVTPEADERISTAGDPPSLRTVMATTENAVNVESGLGSAPTFPEAMNGRVTRYVAEDAVSPAPVGDPVTAKGDAPLAYTLEGSDKALFAIDGATGQITVGMDTKFDYEDPDTSNTYQVTVKVEVTDGDANQKAEVIVDIMVTDVDELPKITDEDVDESPMIAIMYPEIDKDAPNTAAVATYVGDDPEGGTISWDLRGADAALFTIDGGVLKFRAAPDYENPRDVGGLNTATATATASDNVYIIVIRAIASRDSDDTGPAETVDTPVAITVTDVDEKGEVVISWLQPEVGIAITASLTDPDGPDPVGVVDSPENVPGTTAIPVAGATWTWKVSEIVQGSLDIDNDDHWGDAPGTGDQNSYIPAGANLKDDQAGNDTPIDEGKYLRVTASYTDGHGVTKMAHAMSAYPVQALGLGAKNQSPDFVGAKVERSVAETAEVGDDVPGPVVATVRAPSSTDILTYGLRAFTVGDVGDTGLPYSGEGVAEFDLDAFAIDQESGQITVARKLNFERGKVTDDPRTANDGKYVVVVEVFDPSADVTVDPTIGYDFVVVVITAEDINEDPVLSGRPELTINEIDSGDEDATKPLFVGEDEVPASNVYNVVDEDRRAATNEWSLEGDDKDQFQLIGSVGRTLVFRNQPDYENPADADGDNVYKVTVVTLDGHGGRGEFDVCIAVMNINEVGKITLLDEDGVELVQPRARGPITASLTDPDGGVTDVVWVWSRAQIDPPGTGADGRSPIPDAASATYTPMNDDKSYFLHVMATYMDAKNDAADDTAKRTAKVTAMHAVLEKEDLKRSPEFPEETATRTATRMVAENAPSTTFVGDHLPLPMDPDDPQRAGLTYTLEDSDNDSEDTAFFELFEEVDGSKTTQIRVKLHDMAHDLDHEAEGRNGIYEVVLKVTDDSGLEDTITVTITVTDRNEAPSTPMKASGEAPTTPANNAPEFPTTEDGARSVAENTAAGENIARPGHGHGRGHRRHAHLHAGRRRHGVVRHRRRHRPADDHGGPGLRGPGGRRYGQRLRGYRHSQ